MTDTVAQSPFLPGTKVQFAWDSTSLGYLKTCPRLYQYHMIDGWAERGSSAIHLRFGIELHSALQQYDIERAEGRDHDDAVRHVVYDTLKRIKDPADPFDPDRTERAGNYKNPDTLIALIVDYLDKFQDDAAKTYILQDGRPAVELSFRFELDWGPSAYQKLKPGEFSLKPGAINYIDGAEEPSGQPYLLCGHLDRVVDFNDGLYVMDHKTTMTTPGPYYFSQFGPNNQMTLYTIASGIVLDSPVKGVIIDALQILLESPNNFQRGFTYRTPALLNEWLKDLSYWLRQAETFAEANYWPMNDTACDKFGGCRFREICAKDPSAREAFLKGKFDKLAPEDRWNPLKPRT